MHEFTGVLNVSAVSLRTAVRSSLRNKLLSGSGDSDSRAVAPM